jgi:hypothetical protein
MIGSALKGSQGWGIPADFDVAGFTEAAKRNFMALQRPGTTPTFPPCAP